MCELWDDLNDRHAPPVVVRELARMALAAMNSEPVAENIRIADALDGLLWPNMALGNKAVIQAAIEALHTYHVQPAPVVPEEATPDSIEILASGRCRDHVVYQWDEDQRNAAADSWNACRAAMLEADPQLPGSDSAPVPGSWIPVSERMPPSRHEVLVGRWWGEKPRWCCKWATYIPGHPDSQSSGWLIPGASWTPTHWMPLPAAPQEPSLACISKRSQHLS
ncbi:TPA: DUF551 domain-containing protein [Klebsiella pneumoniae]